MRNFHTEICAASLLAATGSVALARSPSGNAVPVTVDNYNRAQSDVYFDLNAKRGGFSKFLHLREPVPLDKQVLYGRTATRCIRVRCSTSTPAR